MRHEKFSSVGQVVDPLKAYATSKRKIKRIYVHCSATKNDHDFGAHDIDDWHMQRWGKKSGCGYHYVVRLDGTVEKGRWSDNSGAQVAGDNANTIGICYIGGYDKHHKLCYNCQTDKQREAMNQLLATLARKYNLPISKVIGHNEHHGVNKACPCLNMSKVRREVGDT